MAVSKRLAPLTLAVVALALTVTGVVYAATDSNPAGSPKDPLALNGYPPKTADFEVKISSGQPYSVDANIGVNFRKNTAEAQLLVPLFFSAAQVDLRMVNGHLYLGSQNLSSVYGAPWIATKLPSPSLFGLSLEMTKPDVSLISGFSNETITKNGYLTTYDFHRNNVIIPTPSASPVKMPAALSIDASITVGSQGELTAASVSETSNSSTLTLSLNVLSYNQPVQVTAPPAGQVKQVKISLLKGLLNATPLKGLALPNIFGSLGKIQLN
ncbi:MAG: hypothetical protein WA786_10910 [Acidimicrobiales bacterium]